MLHIFTSLYISAKYDSVIYVYTHTQPCSYVFQHAILSSEHAVTLR